MASIKPYLDKRSIKKGEKYPLKIQVTHNKRIFLSLDIDLQDFQWKDNLIVEHKDAKRLNSFVEQKIDQIKNILFELRLSGELPFLTDKELKQRLTGLNPEPKEIKPLFLTGYQNYVNRLKKRNTIITLENTHKKISLFCDIDSLTFEEMTVSWLKDFDSFMTNNKMSVNTKGIYFRNIRAIFNDAIDRDYITQNLYPFRRFVIPKAATRKRSLTDNQLTGLLNADCLPYQERYRDLFFLILYLSNKNV